MTAGAATEQVAPAQVVAHISVGQGWVVQSNVRRWSDLDMRDRY
jgi:hypothetical protein